MGVPPGIGPAPLTRIRLAKGDELRMNLGLREVSRVLVAMAAPAFADCTPGGGAFHNSSKACFKASGKWARVSSRRARFRPGPFFLPLFTNVAEEVFSEVQIQKAGC